MFRYRTKNPSWVLNVKFYTILEKNGYNRQNHEHQELYVNTDRYEQFFLTKYTYMQPFKTDGHRYIESEFRSDPETL